MFPTKYVKLFFNTVKEKQTFISFTYMIRTQGIFYSRQMFLIQYVGKILLKTYNSQKNNKTDYLAPLTYLSHKFSLNVDLISYIYYNANSIVFTLFPF